MKLALFLLITVIALLILLNKGLEALLIIAGLVILLALTVALLAYSWIYIREKEENKEEENL